MMRIIFSKVPRVKHRLALFACLALVGCGSASGDGRPTVVATTSHVADLVRQTVGEGTRVVALVPPGADPHGFEPRPRDVGTLTEATSVFRSGGEVDEWLSDTIEAAGGDVEVVDLAERIGADPDDPHWWQNPGRAREAVKVISEELGTQAPAFDRELETLDSDIEACMNKLRPAERKLVTTHDSLGYFARRYGLSVIGAVIPSRSTQAQPSVGDTRELVQRLRRERVRAIFAEHAVPARVERAIAAEAGVKVGRALWTDSLDEGMTYVQAMRENAEAIADGLSGGRVRCWSS